MESPLILPVGLILVTRVDWGKEEGGVDIEELPRPEIK